MSPELPECIQERVNTGYILDMSVILRIVATFTYTGTHKKTVYHNHVAHSHYQS